MSRCTYQVAHVHTISRPVVQITGTYLISPTAINCSPRDYSLFGMWFSKCIFFIFIIVFLIGNFISSPDSAFTWISQDLTHDKTAWLQLMAWCHQWQQAITLDITWANVDPNLCRYMALLVGWVNLSHFKDTYTQSVNTLRPRQNGRHIQGDMFTGIFLNEIYQFQLRFHWCFFLRVQLTISSTGSVNGLSPTSIKQSSERQTISWA